MIQVASTIDAQQVANLQPQPLNATNNRELFLVPCRQCGCNGTGSCGRMVDSRDGSIWPSRDTGLRSRLDPAIKSPTRYYPLSPVRGFRSFFSAEMRTIVLKNSESQPALDAATNRERISKLHQAEWATEHEHKRHKNCCLSPVSRNCWEHVDYHYSKPLYGTTTQADAIAGGWGSFNPSPLDRIASASENSVHLLRQPAIEETSYPTETLGREETQPFRILVASTTLSISVKPLPPCEGYSVRFVDRDATGKKGKTRAKTGAEEVETESTETTKSETSDHSEGKEKTKETTDRVDYLCYVPRYTRSAPSAPQAPAPRLGWFPFRWFPIVGALCIEQIEVSRGGVLPELDRETATRWIGDLTGNAVAAYSEKRKAKIRNSRPPYVVWPPCRKSPFNRDRFSSPVELQLPRYAWNLRSPLRTVADHERLAECITFSEREEAMSKGSVEDDPLTLDDVMWDVGVDWSPIVDHATKHARDFLVQQQGKDYQTPRQREQGRVATLMLQGLTQEQIARRLGMSRHKVRDRIAEVDESTA